MIYAINTDTLGISEYDFRDVRLGTIGDKTVALAETGLYEQCGDTDAGFCIESYITTGALHFGNDLFMKSLSRVHLVAKNAGQLQITLTAYNTQGQETLGPYQTNALQTSGLRGMLVRIPRGTPGTHWKLKVGNVDGGEFDLRGLAVDVQQTRMIW